MLYGHEDCTYFFKRARRISATEFGRCRRSSTRIRALPSALSMGGGGVHDRRSRPASAGGIGSSFTSVSRSIVLYQYLFQNDGRQRKHRYFNGVRCGYTREREKRERDHTPLYHAFFFVLRERRESIDSIPSTLSIYHIIYRTTMIRSSACVAADDVTVRCVSVLRRPQPSV